MSTGWWVLIGIAAWLVVAAGATLVTGHVLWRRVQALEPARPAAERPGQSRRAPPVRLWWVLQVPRRRRQERLARQGPAGEA